MLKSSGRNRVLWGVLLAVGLLHAEAMKPVDVSVGRQLFVDDYLIASTNGVVRHFNHPVKEFDGPVLWPETAYERPTNATHRIAPSVTVNSSGLWWDPHKRVFRLWYESGWISHLSYAESADGVHWTRPDCGIVPGTNLLLPDVKLDTWSVFPDYAAKDPHSAWRMMVSLEGAGATDNLLFTSADGIRWNAAGKAGQSGDCTTLFYDPFRAHWVFSLRDWREPVRRCRRIWTSPTFGGKDCLWSYPGSKQNVGLATPSRWLELDADDKPDLSVTRCRPELYNVDAVAYESVMLGLFKIFHPLPGDNADCVRAGMPKITDLEFAYSRDGINYIRPDRRAAIPAERWGSGKWDTGYLSAVGGICVIRGERLWFYYAATRGDATTALPNGPDWKGGFHWRDSGMHFNASIGAASLRRDGFAGMVADGRGEIVTKPLAFAGGHLFVNAECRFGSVRAEILGADGKALAGFSADDCTAIERCDTTKSELVFRGGDLKALGAKGVRVRFKLHCATLYAFWLSPTARGESLGYVAAGGPDYPGLRDLAADPASHR